MSAIRRRSRDESATHVALAKIEVGREGLTFVDADDQTIDYKSDPAAAVTTVTKLIGADRTQSS